MIPPFDKLVWLAKVPQEYALDLVHLLEQVVIQAASKGTTDEQVKELLARAGSEVHQLRQVNLGHRREIARLHKEIERVQGKASPLGDVLCWQVCNVPGAIFKPVPTRQRAIEIGRDYTDMGAKVRPLVAGPEEDIEPPESNGWIPPAIREP